MEYEPQTIELDPKFLSEKSTHMKSSDIELIEGMDSYKKLNYYIKRFLNAIKDNMSISVDKCLVFSYENDPDAEVLGKQILRMRVAGTDLKARGVTTEIIFPIEVNYKVDDIVYDLIMLRKNKGKELSREDEEKLKDISSNFKGTWEIKFSSPKYRGAPLGKIFDSKESFKNVCIALKNLILNTGEINVAYVKGTRRIRENVSICMYSLPIWEPYKTFILRDDPQEKGSKAVILKPSPYVDDLESAY